jgi:hypothetical protein
LLHDAALSLDIPRAPMKIKVTFREHQLDVYIAGIDNEETGEWLAGQVVAQLRLPCSGRDVVLVVSVVGWGPPSA